MGWEPASEARLADLPAVCGVQRGLLFRVPDPGYSIFALRDGGGAGVLATDAGRATSLDDCGRVALVSEDHWPDPWFLGLKASVSVHLTRERPEGRAGAAASVGSSRIDREPVNPLGEMRSRVKTDHPAMP